VIGNAEAIDEVIQILHRSARRRIHENDDDMP
jgi:hypothetical protein